MKYMMLIHLDQKSFAARPAEEQNRVHQACGAWHDELVESGHSVSCTALQSGDTATTLRFQSGKVVVTDGPFIETKEVLAGFEILECRDLDEALAIVKRFPGLLDGETIELRPLMVGPCEAK
jgi:hypothetical protein